MRALILVMLLSLGGLPRADAADAMAVADAARAAEAQQVLVLLELAPPHFRADGNYAPGYADAAGNVARRRLASAMARRNGLTLVDDWPLPLLGVDCYVMNVPASERPDEVAVRLARDPRVAWAQPMHAFRALGHDDPLYSMQPAAAEWHLSEMHAAATGRGVRVAIVDSGVQLDHPDLASQVASHANFAGDRGEPAESHGTAVAGIVAARADNRVGIVGIAPEARLLALRACRELAARETVCSTLGLALALHAAIDGGAQVINLSLGGPADRLIERLVGAALNRGIPVVAAADRALASGGFPASVPGVVAVVDENGGAAPAGTIAAPGTDIPASLPGSRWGLVSGPSYAAAHVSGMLALMIEAQARTHGPPSSLQSKLVTRADGRIDSCASLDRAGVACACACTPSSRIAGVVTP
jgi:subtilisin family serine protease